MGFTGSGAHPMPEDRLTRFPVRDDGAADFRKRVDSPLVMAMSHVSSIVICLVVLMSACSGTGNDEHAYFTKHGPSYLVELKGRRRLMAHDPVSAVRGRTYEETLTLELPRIEGVIEGAEIPVRPGALRYVGRVVITRGRLEVDLYYDDRDENTKVPLQWNGEYALMQKDAVRAP